MCTPEFQDNKTRYEVKINKNTMCLTTKEKKKKRKKVRELRNLSQWVSGPRQSRSALNISLKKKERKKERTDTVRKKVKEERIKHE